MERMTLRGPDLGTNSDMQPEQTYKCTLQNEGCWHLPVLLHCANNHENCPAEMAHPEVSILVVAWKEHTPHARVRYRFIIRFQLCSSSSKPLRFEEGADGERNDEEDQQEDGEKAEWQVLRRPAPAAYTDLEQFQCSGMQRFVEQQAAPIRISLRIPQVHGLGQRRSVGVRIRQKPNSRCGHAAGEVESLGRW